MSTFTFYDATVAASKNSLSSLSHILAVAEKHPKASTLPTARLAPDMRPLSSQTHLLAQAVQRMLARINGTTFIAPEDDIKTFADMHARITSTVSDLEAVDKDFVNRRADEVESTVLTPDMSKDITAADFAMGASMPNIYFHLNMAYAILRMEGVELGKRNYISGFIAPVLAKA